VKNLTGGPAPEEVHLDQRLLDRVLAGPITLDNRRLERLPAKFVDLQPDFAGRGVQLALVMSGPVIATRLAALVALRTTQCRQPKSKCERFLTLPT
jgi:hypothetical protein